MSTVTASFERDGSTRGSKLDRGVVGDRPASREEEGFDSVKESRYRC